MAEFADKKVVLVGVPGAFTPTCSNAHVPSFVIERKALAKKGIDMIVVIASNDQWVMSGWGKANGVKDDSIVWSTFPSRLQIHSRFQAFGTPGVYGNRRYAHAR